SPRNAGCNAPRANLHQRKAMMRRSLGIVSIAGLIGCATTAGTASPCDLPTPPTAGWTVQDEGAFTLRLPPGYQRVEAQGIDSQVGIWEAPGKRISYALGFYSNPLTPNDVNS